jgi:signal transduction histidine kinase
MMPELAEQDRAIRIRVRLLIVSAMLGLALFAVIAFWTISDIRVGSAIFAQNRIADDIIRDFITPSQSLLSVYPFYLSCRTAHSHDDYELIRNQIKQAYANLKAGHQHYLNVMPAGRLRDLVTVESYKSAKQWYLIAEHEYLPLIEQGNLDQAEKLRIEKMEPLVLSNLAVNEEIGRLNEQWIASNTEYVRKKVWSRSLELGSIGLILLVLQLLLGIKIERRVGLSAQQLQATLEELHRKNTEVEKFVYIVSHDLRAPLVNMLGFVRELEESCKRLKAVIQSSPHWEQCWRVVSPILEGDIAGALHYISASTSKFERLINALQDLSRRGQQVYQPVRLNVWELATSVAASFQQAITEAGAAVEIGALPAVTADATALGQVFSNLIGNALKYRSPDRPLKIELGGQVEAEMVHYWVRDNGLGIPEFGKAKLFQVFQRFHREHAEGEGMGLAIAHRIVERHGGKIWAESREGEGTTFHFSLPCNPDFTAKIS